MASRAGRQRGPRLGQDASGIALKAFTNPGRRRVFRLTFLLCPVSFPSTLLSPIGRDVRRDTNNGALHARKGDTENGSEVVREGA
jgi:hypothetical protein